MWIALSIVGGVVGLIVVMALVGLALPRDHVAARQVTLARPPDEVWRVLADVESQPAWRRGLARVERVSATQFREHGTHGKILYEVTEEAVGALRITRIADDKLPFGGRWIYELAPTAGGTRLTITEDGFIKNPVFRLLAKTVFSTTSTMEKFLADLGAHLGTPAPRRGRSEREGEVPGSIEPAAPSQRATSPSSR